MVYLLLRRFRINDLTEFCLYSAQQLLALFRSGRWDGPPHGPADGLLLMLPGTAASRPIARLIRATVWRGKNFAADGQRMRNRLVPFSLTAVSARLYRGRSRYDGEPCIVLDYSRTSWIVSPLRDEIREIEAGLWLGLIWLGPLRVGFFILRFPAAEMSGRG